MGVCCSRERYLNLDKKFTIRIKTNIYNRYLERDIKRIVDYVRFILQNEGSVFRKYISHYIYVNKIYLIRDRFLVYHIELDIDKQGKHRDRPANFCVGKVLQLDEIRHIFSVTEVMSHVYWSLGTAANHREPLLLTDDKLFMIKTDDITSVDVF